MLDLPTNFLQTIPSNTTSTKPVVLFIHGAWQTPKHYESITRLFEQNGFAVVCPQLPTVGGPPSMKMYDDAKVIRATLDFLVEKKKREVIVIGMLPCANPPMYH